MTLVNHSSRTYLDDYDLNGLLTALSHEIEEMEPTDDRLDLYLGAHVALNIIRLYRLDTQADFMEHFRRVLAKGETMQMDEDKGEHYGKEELDNSKAC